VRLDVNREPSCPSAGTARLEPVAWPSHLVDMSLPTPPVAPKVPTRIEQLGRVRTDDYAWMKDDGWQQVLRDPKALRADVRTHLEAENAYTKAVLAETEALQAQLFAEMKGRIKEDDSSVPSPDGPFDYYVRYDLGAEHPIHARRPRGAEGPETVLLDEEALSKGKAYFHVGAASHSPDHAHEYSEPWSSAAQANRAWSGLWLAAPTWK